MDNADSGGEREADLVPDDYNLVDQALTPQQIRRDSRKSVLTWRESGPGR